jgi:hypothetical protein
MRIPVCEEKFPGAWGLFVKGVIEGFAGVAPTNRAPAQYD